MTGKTDIISDGQTSFLVSNGHPMLANITGSGCMVGTVVATFCGTASLAAKDGAPTNDDADVNLVLGNMLLGALAGYVGVTPSERAYLITHHQTRILAITIASEFAAAREDVKGIGTFLPALLDELYNLTPEKIVERAKVEVQGH
jgi:thiamine-phosphate diphosphorylase/hydroxyethylthiazole kinase